MKAAERRRIAAEKRKSATEEYDTQVDEWNLEEVRHFVMTIVGGISFMSNRPHVCIGVSIPTTTFTFRRQTHC